MRETIGVQCFATKEEKSMPPPKKPFATPPPANGPRQPTNKPAMHVYNPQPTPKVLQKKTAVGPVVRREQSSGKPNAPAAYRPQPVPKVLQTKINNRPAAANSERKQPQAPPAFRPQPVPKVLQKKSAVGQPQLAQLAQLVGSAKKPAPLANPNERTTTPSKLGKVQRRSSTQLPTPSVGKGRPAVPALQLKARNNISTPAIQRQTGRTVTNVGVARVIQRITADELEQLPESYRVVFREWLMARTLPTAERPKKYKDPAKAATHLLSFIPSVDALKMALDSFQANKKADRERNIEAEKMLPQHASKTIASCKTLTDCGVSIEPDALSQAMHILDDDAFFKAHVTLTTTKLKHRDPYDIKVAIGAQLNEETRAFTDKNISYFKSNPEFSTVIHETLHLLCRTPVKSMLGNLLNEGMTELLTEWACADAKAKYVEDYVAEKALTKAAFQAVGKLQKSFLAKTYFSEPKEMAQLLEKKMGRDKFEQFKSLDDAGQALKFLAG